MNWWSYQAERDADFPDVLLIDWRQGDAEGHGDRDENAEADAEKQGPVRSPHGREVDGEDEREEQQVDQAELKATRRSRHGRRPVLLLQDLRIEPRIPPTEKNEMCYSKSW